MGLEICIRSHNRLTSEDTPTLIESGRVRKEAGHVKICMGKSRSEKVETAR